MESAGDPLVTMWKSNTPIMRNRVTSFDTTRSSASSAWTADENPRGRLWGLFAGVFVLLSIVIVRVAYLQVHLADGYQQDFATIRETVESMPSRDARIVSADGQVLAQDVGYFQVAAYYRWLESPPDPKWLRMKARERLTRGQRRDTQLVEAAEREVLAQQKRMWKELAALSGMDETVLTQRRGDIQRRVERIVELVEKRRAERFEEEQASETASTSEPSGQSAWQRGWNAFVKALTTAPDRGRLDPIIVREQQDYHTILFEIDLKRGMHIEAHPERFPGLKLVESTRRRYPHGELAAHVIGYRQPISGEALAQRQARFGSADPLDYRTGDRIGKTGIERVYERQLHGLRGQRRRYLSHRGEIIRTEIERKPMVRPDINLTLDTRLQRHAEQLLDAALNRRPTVTDEAEKEELPIPAGGAIVALDVHSGAILAAASAPRFDLDLLAQGDQEVFEAARKDQRSPFLPRVTRMTLPPGSVFKTLTAAAVLESGAIGVHQDFFCQGYLDDPEHHRCYIFRHYGVGHGHIDMQAALEQSCNVYFYSAARRSGPQPIVDWAARLGFGQPTGIDLPGERGGHLPTLKSGSGRNGRWQVADTLGLAIGQSSLTVTPLQIARLMAVVANGGYLVTPHLVSHVGSIHAAGNDSESEYDWTVRNPQRVAGLKGETLEQIHAGLVRVVEERHGTGYKTVRLPGVAIAGKTGTAEVGANRADHAWFAGYAPAEQPQVAFVVVLQHAGSGGHAAGPLAREFVRKLVELDFVEGKLELAAGE